MKKWILALACLCLHQTSYAGHLHREAPKWNGPCWAEITGAVKARLAGSGIDASHALFTQVGYAAVDTRADELHYMIRATLPNGSANDFHVIESNPAAKCGLMRVE